MEQVLRADALASLAQRHYHGLALLQERTKHAQDMGRSIAWAESRRAGPAQVVSLLKEARLEKEGLNPIGLASRGFGAVAKGIGGIGGAVSRGAGAAWSGGLKQLPSAMRTGFRTGASEVGQALGTQRHLVRTGGPANIMRGYSVAPPPRYLGSNVRSAPITRPGFNSMGQAPAPMRPTQYQRPPIAPTMAVPPAPAPPSAMRASSPMNAPMPRPVYTSAGDASSTGMRVPRPGRIGVSDMLGSLPQPSQQQQQRPMFDIYSGTMLPGREVRASDRAAEALLKLAMVIYETDPDRACSLVIMSGMEKDAVNAAGWLGRQFGRAVRPLVGAKAQIGRGAQAASKWWTGARPIAAERAIGAGHSVQELGVFRPGAVATASRAPGIQHFMEPTGNPFQRAWQGGSSRVRRWGGLAQDPLSGEVIQGPGPLDRVQKRMAQGFSEGLHGPVPGLAPQVQSMSQRPIPQVRPQQIPPQGPYRTPETPPDVPLVSTGAPTVTTGASAEAPAGAGSGVWNRIKGLGLAGGAAVGVPLFAAGMAAPSVAQWAGAPQAPGAYGMGAPMPEMFPQRAVM